MADFDWAETPLGPRENWPQSLKTAVRILLTSRFPMWMGWGPELTFLYNDAYGRMTLGKKHPWALGKPATVVWAEIWKDIAPRIRRVMETGTATWDEGLLLFLERSGYAEETYHTFSYSPLAGDDGAIEGMLCVVSEETDRVIGERRLDSLRSLAASLNRSTRERDVLETVASALRTNTKDLPFTVTYLFDSVSRAYRACCTGISSDHPAAPISLNADSGDDGRAWPISAIATAPESILVDGLVDRFGPVPTGEWTREPEQALVVPIAQPGHARPAGFLVAALNPYRRLDHGYRGFVGLVAGQIGSALANARAHDAERERSRALAELDRAKTEFFSNVSHELRTPLTLLIGPAEDALASPETLPENRHRFELIHRNGLRLLKLVNALLDFSRIEAGRTQGSFQATDLATYTAEVSSTFRSTIEKAGLRFTVDCPSLPQSALIDRDMWEKVVLNLLSNAFKHTFEGEIEVRLRSNDTGIVLTVRDTGVGIAPDQLPRLFERFHRVPNARSRTHEGTGIGLALVQELCRLHDGSVRVESVVGKGSTFVVTIPFVPQRANTEAVSKSSDASAGVNAARGYIEEADRWLPDSERSSADEPSSMGHVLLVDDNADMLEYVERLLRGDGFAVDVVSDGSEALKRARANPPDIVLTDVMMPGIDGFTLLRELKTDPRTRRVPVVMLSARAGEEARVEGFDSGADDYLVKPFSARELLARVRAHVERARLARRVEAEAVEREELLLQAESARSDAEAARRSAEAANRAKTDFLAMMSHELRTPLNAIAGHTQLLEMRIHGPITEAQEAALARVQRSQHHLLSLINDLLNFAKLEAGRVEYDVEELRLCDVVAEVMPMVEPQLEAGDLTSTIDVAEAIVVRADREKLRQILINVLSNAVKFTEPGGRVTIDTASRGKTPVGAVFLRVSDTGIGIPRDKQESIFDPFVQVHRKLTRSTEGTGLGLAISRDLARGMGGEIRVRSAEGSGSTFTIALPAVRVS